MTKSKENDASKFYEYLNDYNKLMRASKMAAQHAHQAALNAMKNLKIESFKFNELSFQALPKSNSKKKSAKLEFEITDEMIKFYEESMRFQKEKSNRNSCFSISFAIN